MRHHLDTKRFYKVNRRTRNASKVEELSCRYHYCSVRTQVQNTKKDRGQNFVSMKLIQYKDVRFVSICDVTTKSEASGRSTKSGGGINVFVGKS